MSASRFKEIALFGRKRNHRRSDDGATLLGSHATRFMLSLIASMSLVLLIARLPIYPPPHLVGWHSSRLAPDELISIEQLTLDKTARPLSETPITRFEQKEEPSRQGAEEEFSARTESSDEETPVEPKDSAEPARMATRQLVLDFSEEMPEIVGGLTAYYINIEYPEAAARAGIEGRLVLDFIVEPNGRPAEIQIMQGLHPLCDSAAVRALRATHFMPGRQNGEVVRVRMRLPVRFQLVGRPSSPGAPPNERTTGDASRRDS